MSQNTTNLYLVGTGLIGKELLKQINQYNKLNTNKITIKGLCSSKYMLTSGNISIDELYSSKESFSLKGFLEKVCSEKSDTKSNTIFVDCTSSIDVAGSYSQLLSKGVHVVTPNKLLASGNYQDFSEAKKIALQNKCKYKYNTNVGAGLPVIETIENMIQTGDEVISIEAILSGTLSYLFNSFDGSCKFSQLVEQAKKAGYTEPQPKDDLNGLDVAKKILILARECGLQKELSDIELESLISRQTEESESLEEFWGELVKSDRKISDLLENAKSNNQKLRYIAKLDNKTGQIKISLQGIGFDHPFYNLLGSDNIVSITTKRYPNPLVIKGAGAGAEVTAAGVLADIIDCMS